MNVEQLIEELQKCNPKAKVQIVDDGCRREVEKVVSINNPSVAYQITLD